MESWGPGMPGPTLFLLLVLPPPLLSLGSFQHSGPGWKDLHHLSLDWGKLYRHLIQNSGSFQHRQGPGTWHRKSRSREDKNSCHSSFDLYFILDMSGSVNNNWMNIYSFVEDLVKKFENPNLRMSFITFSTEGHTVMQLTSDRNEVHDGLIRLQNIVPTGDTYMQEGFKKAIEQIEQAHSGENKVHSMIICLTDGTLEEQTLKETVKEADKARQMGATVYCVGVKNFEEHQLIEIADSPYHVFAVNQGFKALKDIVDPLETKSCIEITSVEPSDICVGDEYELMISGKGFNNAKNEDEVICRFKFKDKLIDEKANSVQDTSMICPGIKIENPDEAFSLEISLNNGISFINSDVSLTSKDCASTRAGGQAQETTTPPAPSAAAQPPPETSPMPPTPPAPPAPPAQVIPYINPLYFFALIPALLLLSLMFCCIWWLCHRRTVKEPPPLLKPEREPEETCQMPCPTVIVPCGCQGGGMKRMEGKLDSLCDFVQRCNQMSVMWCPTRDMGKCVNFALMRPHCGPLRCSPRACVQPSRECFSINNCCSRFQHSPSMCSRPPSRMQPFISTPARTVNRATLSLQPP
ncbi:anthrax toxin receptor-like [Bubalus bubalis]|uniref:anthrax toxin receptor-like n=1 Tax=Bubalus bubalis TaxID=89462 RepID=UPI001E1B9331|nr:anthrax toxin receptor-like [Bubalus bubalis]